MMSHFHNRIKNKRKGITSEAGFTLVEMTVVMVMLSILLSISIMSLVEWQDWVDFKRQNEYAQNVFVAAQNQLTEYSAHGTLEQFRQENSAKVEALSLSGLTSEAGTAYNPAKVWYEAQGKSTSEQKNYMGDLCSISCKRGDYSKFVDNPEDSSISPSARVLFQLLDSRVTDAELLDAAITIEYAPKDGQVFSVCYSDRDDRFVYDSSNDNHEGTVDISNRMESYRRERMVGYYGVETLARATNTKARQPEIAGVTLNNEETLNLSFQISKLAVATQSMIYNVAVFDAQTSRQVMNIEVDGTMLHNKEYRGEIDCPVTFYQYDEAKDESVATVPVTYPVLGYLDGKNVRIVLDAADIQATTSLYETYQEYLDGKNTSNKQFADTYSFHRFGLDANQIYCTVQGSGNLYKATATKTSNTSQVYFAEKDGEDAGNEDVGIANGRHLYNIRYEEDIYDGDEVLATSDDQDNSVKKYHLQNDIDWNVFEQSGSYYCSEGLLMGSDDFSFGTINKIKSQDGTTCTSYATDALFPSFKQLQAGHTFDGKDYHIRGLHLNQIGNTLFYAKIDGKKSSADLLAQVNGDELSTEAMGLFVKNYGAIQNGKLEDIDVSGGDKVGAFCGVNKGKLENLETLNSKSGKSLVAGVSHVGGIMGVQADVEEDVVIQKLVNRGEVQGITYVGGIIGEIGLASSLEDTHKVSITKCKNYGMINPNKDWIKEHSKDIEEQGRSEQSIVRFLGGIAGYCNNASKDTNRVVFTSCSSSPQYSDEDLTNLSNEETNKLEQLYGVYVGGILGYNYYGKLIGCNTLAEDGKEGYVIGYRFVGGIVGCNEGPAGAIAGDSDSSVNEANVLGNMYVGGITGVNANISGNREEDEYVTPKALPDTPGITNPTADQIESARTKLKISRWINRGVVVATQSYAGGIAGYNAGWVYSCNSEVKNDDDISFFQKVTSGDYAGGIAGYNNGIIGKSDRSGGEDDDALSSTEEAVEKKKGEVCQVSGNNYVGGIVGYNDVDAVVEDYKLTGGRITGTGSFVGGYAGMNASVYLLMHEDGSRKTLAANPNKVVGKYFVGGNIGANIVEVPTDQDGNLVNQSGEIVRKGTSTENQIRAHFSTDNFLGVIRSEAFAGGFVGYNLLVKKDVALDANKIQSEILKEIKANDNKEDNLEKNSDFLDNLKTKIKDKTSKEMVKVSKISFVITGDDESETKNSLGSITAKIYVGGVIGYNDKDIHMTIKNVVNTTPINATASINRPEEQKKNGKERKERYSGKSFEYSYAGGIIGKVNHNVVVDHCKNTTSGNVEAKGTYTGGISEINEGNIIDCQVANVGTSATEYIGGITGINKSEGKITQCHIAKKTVTGRNMVGGIVAENFGTVEDSDIAKATINVSGKKVSVTHSGETSKEGTYTAGVAGAVAAYNEGNIKFTDQIGDVTINSKGEDVGGIIGINCGLLKNDTGSHLAISGKITGYKYVGGIIGLNDKNVNGSDGIVEYYENKATVTAIHGFAGGILGNNGTNAKISNCKNNGKVSATEDGNAGGITAFNSSEIVKCTDYASVIAPNGMSGGITATNDKTARIKECVVSPKVGEESVDFSSLKYVGGVAAQNYGEIADCTLNDVNVYNYRASKVSYIGVVAGLNEAQAKITFSENDRAKSRKSIKNCSATTYTNDSFVGGIVGTNKGNISGAKDSRGVPQSIIDCKVDFRGTDATVAVLGGAAGHNLGTIQGISVLGTIGRRSALGSADGGYGGIVGLSGSNSPLSKEQKQQNEYPYTISNCAFDGTLRARGSGAICARMGGIAGGNGYGSQISSCYIGVDSSQTDTKIYAGYVENEDTYSIMCGHKVITQAGDKISDVRIGGIAGENYGKVISCDNYGRSTDNVEIKGFAGSGGGIVGFAFPGSITTGTQDEKLTTGDKWRIIARAYENDIGYGGIIGTTKSGNGISYAENYAFVSMLYNGNVRSAGIVASLMQSEKPEMHFYKTINHGDIESAMQVGGFVGTTRYNTVVFEDCINYGNITTYGSANSNYASGFMAQIHHYDHDLVYKNCKNHGMITGYSYATGFLSKSAVSYKAKLRMENCVNTGIIRKIASNETNKEGTTYNYAPKSVNFSGFSCMATGYYENCRNYNNTDTYGFGKASAIVNSFDHHMATNGKLKPFTDDDIQPKNSFYVTNEEPQTPANALAYFSLHSSEPIKDANTSSHIADYFVMPSTSHRFDVTTTKVEDHNLVLDLDVKYATEDIGMKAFQFYLCNDGNTGKNYYNYTYSVTMTDDNGHKATMTKKVKNVDATLATELQRWDVDEIAAAGGTTLSDHITHIKIVFGSDIVGTAYYARFRGFSWIPNGGVHEGEETKCESMNTYNKKQQGAAFTLAMSTRLTSAGFANGNTTINAKYDQAMFDVYTDENYKDQPWRRMVSPVGAKNVWQQYTFRGVYEDENSSSSGMKSIQFYLSNNTGTKAEYDKNGEKNTGNYQYYAVFTDKNGKTGTWKSEEEPATTVGYYDTNEAHVIPVPEGLDSHITKVVLNIRCVNQNNIVFRGFKWTPVGHASPVQLPYNDMDSANMGNLGLNALYETKQADGSYHLAPWYADAYGGVKNNYIEMHRNESTTDAYYKDYSEYKESYDLSAEEGGELPPKDSRIGVYKELDPKVKDYILQKSYDSEVNLDKPTGLKIQVSTDNYVGGYCFQWDAVNYAYNYEVYYELLDKDGNVKYSSVNDKEFVSSTIRYRIYPSSELDSHWNKSWGTYTIKGYVRAVSAYHIIHEGEADKDKHDSPWVSVSKQSLILLPKPQAHLEPVEGDKYIVVLDNPEDYLEYSEVCNIVFTCTNAKSIDGTGTTVTFSPERGNSDPFSYTVAIDGTKAKDYDYHFQAAVKAEYNTTYMNSDKTQMALSMIRNEDFATAAYFQTTDFLGFSGNSPESLTYRAQIEANRNDAYMAADFTARDENLGVDVAYSQGLVHSSNRETTNKTYFVFELNNLPSDITDRDFMVRTYLFQSQAFMVNFGHYVAKDVDLTSKEDIANVQDTNYYDSTGTKITRNIMDEQGNLRPGYVLYANQKGTYDIYFNFFLEQNEKTGKRYQVAKATYEYKERGNDNSFDTTNYSYANSDGKLIEGTNQIERAPEIESNYKKSINEQGNTTYTFSWDKKYDISSSSENEFYRNATYALELQGVSIDGNVVSLKTISGPLAEQTMTFEDELGNWNYTTLRLQVVRLGTVDGDGQAKILPHAATKEFKNKIPLSSIPAPKISLKSDQEEFNKDGLDYQVIWSGIVDETEEQDLGGYLISVKLIEPGEAGVVAKDHYYYVEDIRGSDASGDHIGLDLAELEEKGVVTKIKAEDYDKDYTSTLRKAIIDLSDFNSGDVVEVTMQAIARSESQYYHDGMEGPTCEVTIPERLKTPDATMISAKENYDASQPMSIAKLDGDGITIQVDNNKMSSTDQGKYVIAVAIYDEAGKAESDQDDVACEGSKKRIVKNGDCKDNASGFWNSGAKKTIYTKKSATTMNGSNLASGKFTIKLTREKLSKYAGQWLKIAIRATADNKISSWWTDEDGDGLTTNYAWIQIPRVQLKEPGLKEISDNIYFTKLGKEVEEGAITDYYITRRGFTFEEQTYADGYRLQLAGTMNSQDQESAFGSWYYLEKQEDSSYKIYTVSSEEGVNVEDMSEGYADKFTNKIGHRLVPGGDPVELPFKTSYTDIFEDKTLTLQGEISLSSKGVFKILLPDIVKVNLDDAVTKYGQDKITVSQLAVQSQAYDQGENDKTSPVGYCDSLIENWVFDNIKSQIFTYEKEAVEPLNVETGWRVTESDDHKKFIFKRTVDESNPLLARVFVKDDEDKFVLAQVRSVDQTKITEGEDTGKYKQNLELYQKYFEDNRKVKVQFSQIATKKNISIWSEKYVIKLTGSGENLSVSLQEDN